MARKRQELSSGITRRTMAVSMEIDVLRREWARTNGCSAGGEGYFRNVAGHVLLLETDEPG